MYSSRLIEQKLEKLAPFVPFGFPRYSVDDARALTAQINATKDSETGQFLRALTDEEEIFVAASKVRVTVDAPFYLETFVWIDEEGHGLRPLYPLWESQRFLLNRLAMLEERHLRDGHPDGLLINILKARQLGMSTFAEALVSQRIFTQPYVRAIAGSDVEEQARYLFKMIERIYGNLPFFLKPNRIVPYQAGRELNLENNSSLKAAWGKTTRGALQETGGKKGNIERGRTNSVVHISELATWDNPEQLDQSLMPGVPVNPDSLLMYESTAELAGDWWHLHWQACEDGDTPRDWSNIFIPWCVEPKKYSLPAPTMWSPNEHTQKVAAQIEREMPQYVGESVQLNRDQLYWYEVTRAYYLKKNQLYAFLREFPSNPTECVTGDTRISTEYGLIPIAEAVNAKRVESGQITNWWNRGLRQTYRIRTKAGRELKATAEHPIALSDGRWVETLHLRAGDEIQLQAPQFSLAGHYNAKWEWAPCCAMEVTVKEDLGRLLGFFIGDGSWGKDCLEIACDAKDTDVVAEVERLCAAIIGRHPNKSEIGRCTRVRSSSVRWWEICWNLGLLERVGTKAGYRKRLRIPECIWRSPKSVVAAFLSGLFESDGHANNTGPQTSLFSKSEELIREVQLLLLGFGINAEYRTAVKHHNGKTYSGRYLRLNAENSEKFHSSIGFVGARKRGTRSNWRRGTGIGRRAIPISLTDSVVSVEPDTVQDVYDIGVAVTNYFGANGIRVHNCFQYAGRSVFTPEDMERIDQAARPLIDVWRVEPSRDIAELRRLSDDPDTEVKLAVAMRKDARPPAPAIIRPISTMANGYQVPPGYGFRRIGKDELDELPNLRHSVMAIWEYPRPRGRRRYVMGVDVGDGLGLDYSVVSIVREPTIDEEMEEVAQYVSNRIKPSQLAYVCDALGRLYVDEDGIEAMAAVELNNHGAVVQDLLQLHLGYTNFYVWEVVDAAQPEQRFTKRIGWTTTQRTRPILLERFHDSVTTIDPVSDRPDFRINSPITRSEMRFFVTENTLGEAEHAKGQHDDAIFGSAIAGLVAHRMAGGETEPISERRRRRDTLKAQRAQSSTVSRDFRNTDITATDADHGVDDDGDDESSGAGLYFDPRNSA